MIKSQPVCCGVGETPLCSIRRVDISQLHLYQCFIIQTDVFVLSLKRLIL